MLSAVYLVWLQEIVQNITQLLYHRMIKQLLTSLNSLNEDSFDKCTATTPNGMQFERLCRMSSLREAAIKEKAKK